MAQKVNPIAVRLNFNRSSDSSWFSDYYYSTILYQDINLRFYLNSIRQRSISKLSFGINKCTVHHYPKRTLIHLFCLGEGRIQNIKKLEASSTQGKSKTPEKLLQNFWQNQSNKLQKKKAIVSLSKFSAHNGSFTDLLELLQEFLSTENTKGRSLPRQSIKSRLDLHIAKPNIKSSCLAKPTKKITNDQQIIKIQDQETVKGFENLLKDSKTHLVHQLIQIEAKHIQHKKRYFQEEEGNNFLKKVVKSSQKESSQRKLLFDSGWINSILNSRLLKQNGSLMDLLCCAPFAVEILFNYYVMQYFFLKKTNSIFQPTLVSQYFSNQKETTKAKSYFSKNGQEAEGASLFDLHFAEAKIADKLFPEGASSENLHTYRNRRRAADLLTCLLKQSLTKSRFFNLSNIQSTLSTNTIGSTLTTVIIPIKVHSIYQTAFFVAQDIALKLEQKRSFRQICKSIFQELDFCKYIKGIRITCSGRLNGAEIAKTDCRKYGETSLHVFSDKIDYAQIKAITPYGILGVKVWISYY